VLVPVTFNVVVSTVPDVIVPVQLILPLDPVHPNASRLIFVPGNWSVNVTGGEYVLGGVPPLNTISYP
jgi:hypothetical protein